MKYRHLGKVFLLEIVTLGIYNLYWLVQTRREMISRGATNIPSVWVLVSPLLALVGAGLLLLITNSTADTGSVAAFNILLYIIGVLSVLGIIVIPIWWTWRYAVGAQQATNGAASRNYVFWMWVVLSVLGVYPVWTLLVQQEFNKLAAPTK